VSRVNGLREQLTELAFLCDLTPLSLSPNLVPALSPFGLPRFVTESRLSDKCHAHMCREREIKTGLRWPRTFCHRSDGADFKCLVRYRMMRQFGAVPLMHYLYGDT
jgi:hypothetical protein